MVLLIWFYNNNPPPRLYVQSLSHKYKNTKFDLIRLSELKEMLLNASSIYVTKLDYGRFA